MKKTEVIYVVREEIIKNNFSNYRHYCDKRGYDYIAFTSIIGKSRTHFKEGSKAESISKDMVTRGEGAWIKKVEKEIAWN